MAEHFLLQRPGYQSSLSGDNTHAINAMMIRPSDNRPLYLYRNSFFTNPYDVTDPMTDRDPFGYRGGVTQDSPMSVATSRNPLGDGVKALPRH